MNDGTTTNWHDSALPEWYNKNMKNIADLENYAKLFNFNKEDALLDLGCGDGTLLKIAAPLCASVCGVDISKEQLTRSKEILQNFDNTALYEIPLQEADFPTESFTKISMRKAIHHLTDSEKDIMLSKIYKWLKPGGLFIVEDMITSFNLQLKSDFLNLAEEEASVYYGQNWPAFKKAFFTTMDKELPCDLATMTNLLLKNKFHIRQIDIITCFMSTLTAQK